MRGTLRPLPLDPNALPRLLVGPILRRVELDLVSVFVATSKPCDVTLLLFPGADVAGATNAADDLRALWASEAAPTLAFGPRLFATVAVLDLRAPGGNAVRSAGQLRPHEAHSYDLVFRWHDGSPQDNLRSLGLLENPVPLGYDPNELPSFITCPNERERLVVVHGSCRRLFNAPPLADDPAEDGPFPPPGGWPRSAPTLKEPSPTERPVFPSSDYPASPKRDGLLWVDALIDQRGPAPRFAGRPHQLFLTGDQIYADDVPDVLLPALSHVGRVLTGDEQLAPTTTGAPVLADLQKFPPGFRRQTVLTSAGLTTSDGASHLLSFAEFAAYYVLTWSPALWDADPWPASPELNPGAFEVPADYLAAHLEPETFARLSAHNPPGNTPTEQVMWFFRQEVAHLEEKYWSPALFEWWTRRFRSGLARVRRVLANVPTFMLMDDHEVSDDWYFSRAWRDGVFTRPLGVSLVRNGMMAYVLFQGWGNDPRRFSAGPERRLLQEMRDWCAVAPTARAPVENRIHPLLGLPFPNPGAEPTFRPQIELSYQVEGPCHRVLVIDGRTRRRFPTRSSQAGGIDYEGPTKLFGDSPMAAALPPRPLDDDKIVFVVAAVPVLGPEGMELALLPFQRLARLLLSVDAEAWSYEGGTFEALMWALSRYGSVVLLSGDIHMGFSTTLDYWSAPQGEAQSTARIIQLVSSGLTQDWGGKTPVLKANALTHDVLEAATTSRAPAERVGFGLPVRPVFAPPRSFSDAVDTGTAVAHPTLRERMKARAPSVPAKGWPVGTVARIPPTWGWRMTMVRDTRPESTDVPNIERRFTPVMLPDDPIAPANAGWHANAARRLSYGRVFAFQPNVGVVTFEKSGDEWSVRHVIAGELPALAGTGAVPVGLQPYVVHRVPLTSPPLATFEVDRPRIRGDGGWGVDPTDPALTPLLEWLPLAWRWVAGHVSPLWPDLPLNLDEAARQAAITAATNELVAPFQRRVLRELGPFSSLTDEELDALDQPAVAALFDRIGTFDPTAEGRGLIRADVERMFDLHRAAPDRAAYFDDALLLACSNLVHERLPVLATIAGLLATFRAPITKQVPVLGGLLAGLWDRWRHRTHADPYVTGISNPAARALAGLVSIAPRAVFFAFELLEELVRHVAEDHDPRVGGGPPIFPPELALTAAGAIASLMAPKRFTVVSGFEPSDVPLNPGARRGDQSALTLARQTLSLLIHPGDRARFEQPGQRLSLTLIPPTSAASPGHVLAAWDGGIRYEGDIGGGVIQRIESSAKAWIRQPWSLRTVAARPAGIPSAKNTLSFLRPTRLDVFGLDVSFTPTLGVSLGFSNDGGLEPEFEFFLSLNDSEDRVRFLPELDGFLSRILPTDGIAIPIDLTLAWNVRDGWRFLGLGEVARPVLEDRVPANEAPKQGTLRIAKVKKLGRFTLHDPEFSFGMEEEASATKLSVKASAAVALNTKHFRMGVIGLGAEVGFRWARIPDETDRPTDPFMTFPPISGVAFSLDVKGLSGGGFLQRIQAPDGAVSWRGGLSFAVGDRLQLTAWAVIDTGGDRHWSMIAVLAGRISPGLPLPFGLRLTAVGGLLALHRKLDTDAVRDAAQGVSGSIDALLFPERPAERFLEMLPSIDRFFPRAEGHHVFGPMIEVEWGKDGATVGRMRAALLIALGDFAIGLFGTVRLGVPSLSQDKVTRIRASFQALYDRDRSILLFTATLLEARVLRTVNFTGGAAVYFRGGSDPEFAITLGGFHPRFRPFIPEGLREPPRVGFPWKPVSAVELEVQAYFAITGSSLQFGASAYLRAGTSWGGIKGDISFDFILLTHPDVYLEADLSFRVTIWLFGADLLSAGLRGRFSGPNRWRLEGTVYWEVCGVDLSKDFGPWEWGDPPSLSSTTQAAGQVLRDALASDSAWSVQRAPRLPVLLRAGTESVLSVRDEVQVRQAELPLDVPLEIRDRNPLSDPGVWSLSVASGGLSKIGDVKHVFPARRFQRKPAKERPFEGGLVAGARFANRTWDAPVAHAIEDDDRATQDVVIDSLPQPPRRVRVNLNVALAQVLGVAAPARAPNRAWVRHAIRLEGTS